MPRIDRNSFARCGYAVVATLLVVLTFVSIGAAQFHLPKIPKLPKGQTDRPGSPEIRPSRPGTGEVVSSIRPDSAPPGGHAEIVLIGQNFKDKTRVQFSCIGAQFSPDSVKVESPTRIVAQVTVPIKAQEGPCGTSLRNELGKEPFRISNSASMPVAVPIVLIGEGDMQFMDLMMSLQKSMMAGFGNAGETGRLEIDGGSLKYVKGSSTTFTESVSAVKSMGEMKQGGQPVGIFRMVFNDGKIYNFGGMGNAGDGHMAFEYLQKKLGK